ncbi:MAG: hypothetical protein WC731_05925 [Candidatus Omnitrophota bacterium]|jgi:hypothetical protein
MGIAEKTVKEYKKTCKEIGRGISNKNDLEVVWEQVLPEDAEQRIQRAFEILLNKTGFPY